MVRTRPFHCSVPGSSPGWGTKIPQAVPKGKRRGEKKREKDGGGEPRFNVNYSPWKRSPP